MTKIISAKIWDLDLTDRFPHHNMTFIQLFTDNGYEGLGEIALAYGMGAKAAQYLSLEIIQKLVIGRDPFNTQAIWCDIEQKTYWAEGRNLMHRAVQSAVDIALWDIKGKILQQPVYNLLGGRVRDSIDLYANHWYGEYHKPEDYAKAAQKVVVDGYKGLKFDPFRMSPEGLFCIPPRPLPKYWGELAVKRAAAVREAVGDDMHIIIDAHATLSVSDAIKWGKKLEPLNIFYYEEPVVSFNPEETLEVKAKLDIPLAGGERLYCKQDFMPYLEKHAFELIQPDICLAGGFTGMKEIAILAETKNIYLQPHNCAGAISSAASVHFAVSQPNIFIQEWFPYWEDDRYSYVKGSYERAGYVQNGRITPPALPGLGLALDDEKMQPFSYLET